MFSVAGLKMCVCCDCLRIMFDHLRNSPRYVPGCLGGCVGDVLVDRPGSGFMSLAEPRERAKRERKIVHPNTGKRIQGGGRGGGGAGTTRGVWMSGRGEGGREDKDRAMLSLQEQHAYWSTFCPVEPRRSSLGGGGDLVSTILYTVGIA